MCCLRPPYLVVVVIVTSVVLGSVGSTGALCALPAAGAASAANAAGAPDAVPVSSCRGRQTTKMTEREAGDDPGKREGWGVAAGCRTLEPEREAQQQPIIRKLSTQSHAALEESQRDKNCSCHFKSRINNLPNT